MLTQIKAIHTRSDQTYGMPRILAELKTQGIVVNHKRVARLMRTAKLYGVSRRRGFTVTTQREEGQPTVPDLVNRQFTASALNQLWIADMTYIPT